MTDYYEVLGVSPDASGEEIKRAFRTLAREHHPDVTGGDPASEQRYKEVSEAYAVLSDPNKRREYDAARSGIGSWSSPWGSPFASTIEDIFESFFGGGVRSAQRPTRARPGESVEIELEITLSDAVFGGERTLRFERFEPCTRCAGEGAEPGTHPQRCERCGGAGQVQETRRTVLGSLVTAFPCRTCSGTGSVVPNPCTQCRGSGRQAAEAEVTVAIPAGIDDGDRLRLSGEGEAGSAGGGRGDLYVRFVIEPDARFERAGEDLYSWVAVPMTVAALGGKVRVETLDGEETIDIAAGTQSGELIRLKGRGAGRRSGRGRGELVLRVHVQTPRKLGRKEKDLVRKLAQTRDEDGDIRAELRRSLQP